MYTVVTQQTNEVMVKSDFDGGRENANMAQFGLSIAHNLHQNYSIEILFYSK